ncbi:MAG: 30S ribosomal protein S10 [Flavobacteriales bacterium]|nr:30S ribosomal protein S10 [Flavobacteriales bacterium]|tara:strand:+ start:534 stop:854 length:321 start_codon:yes stop_codon:yes gene_type:complete
MSQKIQIKLKSYDHTLVDKSAAKIVKIVKSSGAVVDGPIPLPTRKNYFTVLRSPHVNKKSREQFRLFFHKRLMIIHTSSNNTISELTKLDLPAGVDIDVKDLTILN